jgi:hypothetical protein
MNKILNSWIDTNCRFEWEENSVNLNGYEWIQAYICDRLYKNDNFVYEIDFKHNNNNNQFFIGLIINFCLIIYEFI